ncbi:small GTP-binding protein, putative [Trichomonas vaginalis G3]|uniref:Small GTP-binding protein, putative n=1 Tax=Trichomonas vaginalis (strain ATCC PRA-98 / G3) TaxID=412133 RepID=A2FXZ3_TRIV3|nr:retrograde vesicle-mediated transport, Golgi to ER [Trichomonas vaginalis G3]EAX90216.1 small GTP-binding protein, putative [Trichomonas vaginalis G3]KAI5553947.1 retrograde vesicle-mediated transport, Golgi to ER [Trichomonas vaginalis G3]|eukprot:XP_001303146.1 small GTP-binding protein [Trichomonas vaginalis G3]
MSSEAGNVPHFKVVLLGNSGTGKTSIINRWVTNQFSPITKSTIGSNHSRKRVEISEGLVDLFVWDTAGQEEFQALMPLYARNSSLAIIVCAINDSVSFDAIPKWIENVSNACDPCPPMILAINKIDLSESAVNTMEEVNNKYGDQFIGIFMVSALSGEGVENLFYSTASEVFKNGKKLEADTQLKNREANSGGCC